MKKNFIIPLLALTLIAGIVTPAKAITYSSHTSKKYELHQQEKAAEKEKFIANTSSSGVYNKGAIKTFGVTGSATKAYFMYLGPVKYFGIQDPEEGSFIIPCKELESEGRVMWNAYINGESDEAYYVYITGGNLIDGMMSTVKIDHTLSLKVYKDVTEQNGIKFLNHYEVLYNGTGGLGGENLNYVQNVNGYKLSDTSDLTFDCGEGTFNYWDGKKGVNVHEVNDHFIALNNTVYFLKDGNTIYKYEKGGTPQVVGTVAGQGTEIYVTRDCKQVQVYNSSKQLVGSLNI